MIKSTMAKDVEPALYPGSAATVERSVVQSTENPSDERTIFQGLSDRWQALKERSFGGYFEERRRQKVREYESAALAGERQLVQVKESMAKLGLAGSPAAAEAIEKLEAEIAGNRDRSDVFLEKISDQRGYGGGRDEVIVKINGHIAEKHEVKKAELTTLKKLRDELEQQRKVLEEKLKVFKALSEQFAQDISRQKGRKQRKGMESAWQAIAKEYQKTADISVEVERELESVKKKIEQGETDLKDLAKNLEKRKIPGSSGATAGTGTSTSAPLQSAADAVTLAGAAVEARMQEGTVRRPIIPSGSAAMQ